MRSIGFRVWTGTLTALLALASPAWAQVSSRPTRTLCKQWDDAYLGAFETGFWVCAVATFVLAVFAGPLGRWFWIAAAPRLRILVVAILVPLLVGLGVVALPWMIGFGWLWFAAIDTAYFDCVPMGFGATGFFTGLVGSGVPAIAQWPTMVYLLMIPAAAAGLFAWLVGELGARFSGLRQRARKEGV